MHVVQLLLPIVDNDGLSFPDETMRPIREELLARFGGVTAFSRTPAQGEWSDHGQKIRDDIILVEVMVEQLELEWWRRFGEQLEDRLCQKSVVIRAFAVDRL